MRRKKVWVPEGDQISFLAMQELGLSPVVLPITDVLTGLQTGLIEIAFASPVAALVLQWHTKTKYITDLPISYSMGIFALDKGAFAQISVDDQKIVREVMQQYMGELDKTARTDNQRAQETLLRSGLQPVSVDAANVDDWRQSIEAMFPRLRARPDIDAAMFDELLGILADYRRAHP